MQRFKLHMQESELDQDIGLRWTLRRAYRAGASPQRGSAPRESASGMCRLVSAGKEVRALADWPAPPVGAGAAEPSPDPAVLAQRRVGERNYRLLAKNVGGNTQTLLAAHDAVTGEVTWEHVLDQTTPRPPRPLRP